MFTKYAKTLFIIIFFVLKSNGQNYGSAIKSDSEKLLLAYTTPLFKTISSGLYRNWQTTARPKEIFEFDFKIQMTFIPIPQSYKSFDITKLELSHLKQIHPTNFTMPTIIGGEKNNKSVFAVFTEPSEIKFVIANGDTITQQRPSLPINGTYFNLTPVKAIVNDVGSSIPLFQLDMSIARGTEILFRYGGFHKDYVKINAFGLAIKQNINILLFPEDYYNYKYDDDDAKVVNCSVLFGYNTLNLNSKINLKSDTPFSKNRGNTKLDALNTEILLSKKVSFADFFIAAGVAFTSSKIELLGNYTLTGMPISDYNTKEIESNYKSTILANSYVLIDPVQIKTKAKEFYTTIGVQFSYLKFMNSSLSYSYGNNNQSFNLSFGFSVNALSR
ncbi:DUF6588 family protein [Flavobacterium sp. LAR06]|uniref:DUF6588 family protein n=1 Tax=Flavobacterium sp. LAR06 TaxID=3064897 RepID=UPI0035BF95DA